MNNPNAWFQFALYVGALLLITKPLGLYLVQVLDAQGKTWLDPVVKPFERLTYRLCGIDPEKEQGWIGYTFALLAFSLVGMLFTYFILRFQDHLPLNPQGCPASRRTSRSTPRRASRPTPTGRATAANRPCRTSRRWSR
jgi:K+-transporting ATPase ATPase A chain